jgi:hypothetical protein
MNLQPLNLKSEVDRRKTFKYWHVPFMDVNQLAAAAFFFTNRGDVVRCAFCGVEVGHWIEGDGKLKDHWLWSPSCVFVKGLFAGDIRAPSETSQQQRSRSNDVCGPYMECTLKTSRQILCKYIFNFIYFLLCIIITVRYYLLSFTAACFREHNTLQWDGPIYPCHITPESSLLQIGLPLLNKTLKI